MVYDAIIIGSGFGGICSAIQLQKNGVNNFLILEKFEELGGTWWRNSYPGAAVDVISHLYSLSFEPYSWTRLFAHQPELLKYTHHVIDKHKLRKKARVNSGVKALSYRDESNTWKVKTESGDEYLTKTVINAIGVLSHPKIPKFKGLEKYSGKLMHTNLWDHSFDYKNKRVAVIGTGASAIQVIPAIAPEVESLHIYQRSPHWIVKRPDRILKQWERNLLKKKFFEKLFRYFMYWKMEFRVIAFSHLTFIFSIAKLEAIYNIWTGIKNKSLRKKVTPDYKMGCKRVLLSNEYYPTLERENVSLFTKDEGIESFTEKGIRTLNKGEEYEYDLVVCATGFEAADNVIPFEVIGKNGLDIREAWKEDAHAYWGTTVPGFPNLFMVGGPNTGTGHTSSILFLEGQANYISDAISQLLKNNWKSIEVKAIAEKEFNKKIQKALAKTIWLKGGCDSWYLSDSGKNTTLFPYFSFTFLKNTRKFEPEDHWITP